jgi:hypothetical protein
MTTYIRTPDFNFRVIELSWQARAIHAYIVELQWKAYKADQERRPAKPEAKVGVAH